MKSKIKERIMLLIMQENMNFISFKNNLTSSKEVGACGFTVELLTNKDLIHVLTFSSHCKLLSYKLKGSIHKFDGTRREVNKLLEEAKSIHKSIVGGDYYK